MGVGKIRAAIAALGLACVVGAPAAAAPNCWSPREVNAAKVRDLQTMLMVGALQCRGVNPAVLASYNKFVAGSREALGEINGVIRAHFLASDGRIAGERSYDAYTTKLANDHARDTSGDDYCGTVVRIAEVAADTPGAELVKLADEVGVHPVSDRDSCPVSVAAAAAVAAENGAGAPLAVASADTGK
jgi:hypothetical protein